MSIITSFTGTYEWLSNFYHAPIHFFGNSYATAEHLYQAFKAKLPGDRDNIRLARTPGKAKRLGNQVTLRDDFVGLRVGLMLDVIRLKFFWNPLLADLLVAEKDVMLIEGNNWHDNFWGACTCAGCHGLAKNNILGQIIMHTREELIHQPLTTVRENRLTEGIGFQKLTDEPF